MDSLITAAARALAAGDPLAALNRVALRNDAPALALRGIAMAQLGDLTRARSLVRRAARAFAPAETVARARCAIAEAEIALAARELKWPERALASARATLEQRGDVVNAAHAAILAARCMLLTGQVDRAEATLATVDAATLPPALQATRELVAAGVSLRRLRTNAARSALVNAARCAEEAAIPALVAEVENAALALDSPAAVRVERGTRRELRLDEVEALLASKALIVDACRYDVREAGEVVSLARRPVLFALARHLAEAWPADVPREQLIAQAFRARHADESHRARLRVEIGRLRAALRPLAAITATPRGFALTARRARNVVVLTPTVDDKHGGVLALLADGQPWSSSALGLALGASQRSVQRALDALAATGKVQSLGRGRARRWITPPVPGFTTTLLLPVPAGD